MIRWWQILKTSICWHRNLLMVHFSLAVSRILVLQNTQTYLTTFAVFLLYSYVTLLHARLLSWFLLLFSPPGRQTHEVSQPRACLPASLFPTPDPIHRWPGPLSHTHPAGSFILIFFNLQSVVNLFPVHSYWAESIRFCIIFEFSSQTKEHCRPVLDSLPSQSYQCLAKIYRNRFILYYMVVSLSLPMIAKHTKASCERLDWPLIHK